MSKHYGGLGQCKAWKCQASPSVGFPLAGTENSGDEARSLGIETAMSDVRCRSSSIVGSCELTWMGGVERRVRRFLPRRRTPRQAASHLKSCTTTNLHRQSWGQMLYVLFSLGRKLPGIARLIVSEDEQLSTPSNLQTT
jgi:hypothetical protein